MVFDNDADTALWDFLYGELCTLDEKASQLHMDWKSYAFSVRERLMETLGYSSSTPIEEVANTSLTSLQFIEHVLR
jgi:hypothetical protein